MIFGNSIEKILSQESPKTIIFDLASRLGKDRSYYEFSDAEKLVWCVYILFAEAKNGTLEQYASNSSGDLFGETRQRLGFLGAHSACDSLDALNKILGGKMTFPRKDRLAAIEAACSADEGDFENSVRRITDSIDWKHTFEITVEYLKNHKEELS